MASTASSQALELIPRFERTKLAVVRNSRQDEIPQRANWTMSGQASSTIPSGYGLKGERFESRSGAALRLASSEAWFRF